MPKDKKPKPQVRLTRNGVFLIGGESDELVSSPILNNAIGTRVPGGTKFAQIAFEDLDGNHLIAPCDLADFAPANRRRIIDRISNLGYRWPQNREIVAAIISRLSEDLPSRRFKLVGAPGWHDGIYVTERREYSRNRDADRLFEIDDNADAHLAHHALGTGSLKGWKQDIGMLARKSSCLRLSIAAALAATMLRPLGIDSFGLNFYSDSSTGKTSAVFAGAGAAGIIVSLKYLPGWADSKTGVEELLAGHRDGPLPLDDANAGDDGDLPNKIRLLSYTIARGTRRNLSRRYEKAATSATSETRNIVLSSSEDSLADMVAAEGHKRWAGEEVRLIDVPATFDGSAGIFDKPLKYPDGVSRDAHTAKLVDKLKIDALIHQGFVLDRFMKLYVNDDEAIADLRGYMDSFLVRAKPLLNGTSDQRIASKFAVIYATACLAIDYDIFPWAKKSTFKAFKKCLVGSLSARHSKPSVAKLGTVVTVAQRLSEHLGTVQSVKIKKRAQASSAEAERRQTADAFETDELTYVKPEAWPITNPKETKLLVKAEVLVTESRGDVATMAKKVGGIDGKPRYYVVDRKRLASTLGGRT